MCLVISAVFLNFPVSSLVFLKWSRIFLQKRRFFHHQSHGKTPFLGPFHLFSEPVLARGIIRIGLFQRKSWKIVGNRSNFIGEFWFQQMQSMQVGWLEPTENIVNEELLAVNSLGIWLSWDQNRPKSDQNGIENRTC